LTGFSPSNRLLLYLLYAIYLPPVKKLTFKLINILELVCNLYSSLFPFICQNSLHLGLIKLSLASLFKAIANPLKWQKMAVAGQFLKKQRVGKKGMPHKKTLG
jgi:hypothetical protein